ncbi:MAG: DNA/RNA nuclease SfsA [Pseudomonadota bacterium]
MEFESPLLEGTLLKRYKRFLADVRLDSGQTVTAHCPNTGGMFGCQIPGSRVALCHRPSPRRKLDYRWELASDGDSWVGIHSAMANDLVAEAHDRGELPGIAADWRLRREVSVGDSRLDFLFTRGDGARRCFVEVKSVTASLEPGVAAFPDAVTTRGRRHIETLQALRSEDTAVMLLFCVQRADCRSVRAAHEFDPAYAEALTRAAENGVTVRALGCRVDLHGIEIAGELPVVVS